jgi:hypothetical protein
MARATEWAGIFALGTRFRKVKAPKSNMSMSAVAGRSSRTSNRSLEREIGEVVANAVSALARGLIEYNCGGLKRGTQNEAAEHIAQLYVLWNKAHAEGLRFGDAAQIHGRVVLRERFGDANDGALNEMISWPLELVHRLANSEGDPSPRD